MVNGREHITRSWRISAATRSRLNSLSLFLSHSAITPNRPSSGCSVCTCVLRDRARRSDAIHARARSCAQTECKPCGHIFLYLACALCTHTHSHTCSHAFADPADWDPSQADTTQNTRARVRKYQYITHKTTTRTRDAGRLAGFTDTARTVLVEALAAALLAACCIQLIGCFN